ncbi:MAG: hypothetical protein ABSE89_09010 [Sedimentisphaerales bacterium]
MFILLGIGKGAWAVIAVVTLIVILIAATAIKKKMYPEKMDKPWKKV